jgi:hypothetical protein
MRFASNGAMNNGMPMIASPKREFKMTRAHPSDRGDALRKLRRASRSRGLEDHLECIRFSRESIVE